VTETSSAADRRLVRDVLLRDGTVLRLRAPHPEDLDDLQAFYDALSPDSRYMRFHGYGRTDLAARQYADADGADRVALIGRHGDRIVAAAGYDRLREPGTAEVAFAVADDYRRRGAATRLLEQLAAIAAARGIHRFYAEVLADNRPMLTVFRQAGFGLRRRGLGGELTVALDITPSREVLERIDERDHQGAVASLRALLAPGSIAVVGAAAQTGNVGAQILARLVEGDFCGPVAAVDRSGGIVRSLRAVRRISELEAAPDLAILALPAAEALDAARDAITAGCRALLVVGAQSPATDEPSDGSEQAAPAAPPAELLDVVRSSGARLIGPNSLGLINTDPAVRLRASAARAAVTPGRLAICSQSGAIGIGLLGQAAARSLGVSAFVSLGDRIDVSTNDLLELWEEDERTAAVMLYLETFGNPERFGRIARRVSRRKPILAVKGRGEHDRRQPDARSHTAAALRSDAAIDAMLRQAGVMRFRSGEELFNAAEFFECQPLPRGRRMGIVSNSQGLATLARDACATRGLLVEPVGQDLAEFGAPAGAPAQGLTNPLILGLRAAAPDYGRAVARLLADHDVDAVIASYVELSDGDPAAVLDAVQQAAEGSDKPIVASIVGADGRVLDAHPGAVPNFQFPEAGPAVLARGAERREWLSRPLGQVAELEDLDPAAARAVIDEHLTEHGEGWLTLGRAERLLATHGISFAASRVATTVEAAVAAAARLPGPLALKADFPPPAHASDIDAVLLGLEGPEGVRAGWRELARRVAAAGRSWRGVIVQPLAPGGADVLVGSLRDPELGPLMAVGLGGRQAGLSSGAGFRLLPVTDIDADELIGAAEGVAAQLDGFRGLPILDRQALRELVLRFARLLREVPAIVEVDLNPVRVTRHAATVLDLRVRAAVPRPPERTKTW
jgi:acyl-CoA synthetase (NDP forming)/RimJ/RimL family protein N-acetyltransferase